MAHRPTTETNRGEPFRETLDEHRACMRYVEALEACLDRRPDDTRVWVAELLQHLPGLARSMREHFEAEEDSALFKELPLRNPTVSDRLDALKQEHPRLMREVERIIEITDSDRRLELHELRELNARIQLFVARLRRHEATENELIFEAYWDDYGTGD